MSVSFVVMNVTVPSCLELIAVLFALNGVIKESKDVSLENIIYMLEHRMKILTDLNWKTSVTYFKTGKWQISPKNITGRPREE